MIKIESEPMKRDSSTEIEPFVLTQKKKGKSIDLVGGVSCHPQKVVVVGIWV